MSQEKGFPLELHKAFTVDLCSDDDEEAQRSSKYSGKVPKHTGSDVVLVLSGDEDDEVTIIDKDERVVSKKRHKKITAKAKPDSEEEIFNRITKAVQKVNVNNDQSEREAYLSSTPTPPPPPLLPTKITSVQLCSLLDDDVQDAVAYSEEIVLPPPPPPVIVKCSSPELSEAASDKDTDPLFTRRQNHSVQTSSTEPVIELNSKQNVQNVIDIIDDSTFLNIQKILESLKKPTPEPVKKEFIPNKELELTKSPDYVLNQPSRAESAIESVSEQLPTQSNMSHCQPQQNSIQTSDDFSNTPSCSHQSQQRCHVYQFEPAQHIATLPRPTIISPVRPPPPQPNAPLPVSLAALPSNSPVYMPTGSTYPSSSLQTSENAMQTHTHAFHTGVQTQDQHGYNTLSCADAPNFSTTMAHGFYAHSAVLVGAVPAMVQTPQFHPQYGYNMQAATASPTAQWPNAQHAYNRPPSTSVSMPHGQPQTLVWGAQGPAPNYIPGYTQDITPSAQPQATQVCTQSAPSLGPASVNNNTHPQRYVPQQTQIQTSQRPIPSISSVRQSSENTKNHKTLSSPYKHVPTSPLKRLTGSVSKNEIRCTPRAESSTQLKVSHPVVEPSPKNAIASSTPPETSLPLVEPADKSSNRSTQISKQDSKSQNLQGTAANKTKTLMSYEERKRKLELAKEKKRLEEEEAAIREEAKKADMRKAEILAKRREEQENKNQKESVKEALRKEMGKIFRIGERRRSSVSASKAIAEQLRLEQSVTRDEAFNQTLTRPNERSKSISGHTNEAEDIEYRPKKIDRRRRSSVAASKAIAEQLRLEQSEEGVEAFENEDKARTSSKECRKTISGHTNELEDFEFRPKKIDRRRRSSVAARDAIAEQLRSMAEDSEDGYTTEEFLPSEQDEAVENSEQIKNNKALRRPKERRKTNSSHTNEVEEFRPKKIDRRRRSSVAARDAIAEQLRSMAEDSEESETQHGNISDDFLPSAIDEIRSSSKTNSKQTCDENSEINDEVFTNNGTSEKSLTYDSWPQHIDGIRRSSISARKAITEHYRLMDEDSDDQIENQSPTPKKPIVELKASSATTTKKVEDAEKPGGSVKKTRTKRLSSSTNENEDDSKQPKLKEPSAKNLLPPVKRCKVVLAQLPSSEISEAESATSLLKRQSSAISCDEHHKAPAKPETIKRARIQSPAVVKNTDRDMTERNCKFCALCFKRLNNLTDHYIHAHKTESYVSRLTWEELNELELKAPLAEETTTKLGDCREQHYKVDCPFCPLTVKTTFPNLRRHYSSHTGEYAYSCKGCGLKKPFRDLIKRHQKLKKCGESGVQTLYQYPLGQTVINMYLCYICNYVQLNEENIFKHLREQHGEVNKDSSHVKEITLASIKDGPVTRIPLGTLTNVMSSVPTKQMQAEGNVPESAKDVEQVLVSNEPLLEESTTELELERLFEDELRPDSTDQNELIMEPSCTFGPINNEEDSAIQTEQDNIDFKPDIETLEHDFQSDINLLPSQDENLETEHQTTEDKPSAEELLVESAKALLRKYSANNGIQPDLLYECSDKSCGGFFSGFSLWLKHMKAHHNLMIAKCPHCCDKRKLAQPTEFPVEDFEQHFKRHCMRLYFCFYCDHSFNDEAEIRKHATTAHAEFSKLRLECIPNNISYSFHIIIEENQLTERLQFLTKLNEVFKARLQHLEATAEDFANLSTLWSVPENAQWLEYLQLPCFSPKLSPLLCPKCMQKFTSVQKLIDHTHTHNSDFGPPPFQCDICRIEFKTDWTHLLKHRILHSKKIFVCCVCSYNTANRREMVKHACSEHDRRDVPVLRLHRASNETKAELTFVFAAGSRTFTATTICFFGCGAINVAEESLISHLRRKHSLKLRYFCNYCDEQLPNLQFTEEHHRQDHTDFASKLKFKIHCQIGVSKECMLNIVKIQPLKINLNFETHIKPSDDESIVSLKKPLSAGVSIKKEKFEDGDIVFMEEDEIIAENEARSVQRIANENLPNKPSLQINPNLFKSNN